MCELERLCNSITLGKCKQKKRAQNSKITDVTLSVWFITAIVFEGRNIQHALTQENTSNSEKVYVFAHFKTEVTREITMTMTSFLFFIS